jgi:glycosyltransferase involved in cell wall biosynthesis
MTQQKMKIVVPVYNAQEWIKGCVESIKNQQHKNFECIIINDASKDETGSVIDSLALDSRFSKVHNKTNQGALWNIVNGFKHLKTNEEPESILMAIDGDDRLASPTSLSVIDKIYTKMPNNLLTYGSYVDSPSGAMGICEAFPAEVIKARSYRAYPKFVTSHLRTFKSKLWHKLNEEDLIDPRTGKHYSVTWDLAFMMPMLEMAGDNFIFVPQILYLYNRTNPISDGYIRGREQWETDQFIRKLPKKEVVKW